MARKPLVACTAAGGHCCRYSRWMRRVYLQADMVDIAFPSLFQSGGSYDLKQASVSSDEYMHYGVIMCSLGAR